MVNKSAATGILERSILRKDYENAKPPFTYNDHFITSIFDEESKMFYCHIDGRFGKGFPLELAEEGSDFRCEGDDRPHALCLRANRTR